MMSRSVFLQQAGLAGAAVLLSNLPCRGMRLSAYPTVRLPLVERKFISPAVEQTIVRLQQQIKDPELAWLFGNCFPNTLDTTVYFNMIEGLPDTFVITGDIHAMWLRDSTAQVWPYLSLVKQDAKLQQLIAGVVHRQARCICLDPYANAFNDGPTGSEWAKDLTDMRPELHERKWEIDSLCYPVRLAYHYWKQTGDATVFDDHWARASQLILRTFTEQQRKTGKGPYRFGRVTSWSTDTVPGDGYGNPIKPVGLIVSIFRPSDDATIFPFLVPSNFFAVVSLQQLSEIHATVYKNSGFAQACRALAAEVHQALQQHAVVHHPRFGKIYAYEVDGFGNHLLMDDSNVPSLLSLPYLGAVNVNDPVYQNTRHFALSTSNPYFFPERPHQARAALTPLKT